MLAEVYLFGLLVGAATATTTGLGDSSATGSTEATGVLGDSAVAVMVAGFEGVLFFLDSDSEPKISEAASPALAKGSSAPTALPFGFEVRGSGFFGAAWTGAVAATAAAVAGD